MARKTKGKAKRKAKGLKHSKRTKATRQTKATKPKKMGGHGTRRSAARKPKQEAHAAAQVSTATEEVLDTTDSDRLEDAYQALEDKEEEDEDDDDDDTVIDPDGDRSR